MADILKVCIATSKAPTISMKQDFIDEVRGHAQDAGLRISAMLGREGYGCYNLGLKIEGDRQKAVAFVNGVTIALGPISRWSHCNDEFEGFVLEDLRE